jgi:hypothetical protein
MAFIPGILPYTDTSRGKLQISPQVNPSSEGVEEKRGSKAEVRTRTNSKSNTSRDQGSRDGRQQDYNRRQTSRAPKLTKSRDFGKLKPKASFTLNASDFGFDILGSSTPTVYTASQDQTLFRDYNVRGSLPALEHDNSVNDVTNAIKLLDINFSESVTLARGYSDSWNEITDMIQKEVSFNTKSAKGALDRISASNLLNYLNVVSEAFDFAVQLEVLQAWNPTSNDYYDSSLRQLASLACTPELLRARTSLRAALLPHVLPEKWMTYIRWIRETKLRNICPESTKERFISVKFAELTDHLSAGTAPTSFIAEIGVIVAKLRILDPFTSSIILNNADSINFSPVKDKYNHIHNSAVYDGEFNNVWTNRCVVSAPSGGSLNQYPSFTDGRGIGAFDSTTPSSISVATIAQQSYLSGVPLEGMMSAFQCAASSGAEGNNFYYYIGVSGTVLMKGVEHWYESVDDSMHIVENITAGVSQGISIPKGVNTSAFVLSDSNIQMAARVSLSEMTFNYSIT